jgi:hypothetical protein
LDEASVGVTEDEEALLEEEAGVGVNGIAPIAVIVMNSRSDSDQCFIA